MDKAPWDSSHADEARADLLQERVDRFLPRGRDWWQAREDEGLPTLAEEGERNGPAHLLRLSEQPYTGEIACRGD